MAIPKTFTDLEVLQDRTRSACETLMSSQRPFQQCDLDIDRWP